MDEIFGPDNLLSIYFARVVNSSARGRDGLPGYALGDNLEETIALVSSRLRSGNYTFTQYRQNLLPRGAEKAPRILAVPTARDRIALRAIAEALLELFPECQTQIPQAHVIKVHHALRDGKFDTFMRVDIQDFYQSIPHDLLLNRLTNRTNDARLMGLVQDAIETPTVPDHSPRRPASERNGRGVPQGLAVSNVLAELLLAELDSQMSSRNEIEYTRYVDDILVLCHHDAAARIAKTCENHLRMIGLEIHPFEEGSKSKIGPVTQGFDYLGYVFRPDRISVRPASVRRIESRLARAFTEYKRNSIRPTSDLHLQRCLWFVNLAITGCIRRRAARGWLHYFRQLDDLTLLKKLDQTVDRFCKRFGMPTDFKPKKFIKSYWAIRHPEQHDGYIPVLDNLSDGQMREHLSILGMSDVSRMTPIQVRIEFNRLVDRAVRDLEEDVASLS